MLPCSVFPTLATTPTSAAGMRYIPAGNSASDEACGPPEFVLVGSHQNDERESSISTSLVLPSCVPVELWTSIFSVFTHKYLPRPVDAPYPLSNTGQVTWDLKTLGYIGLTCKMFYGIVISILGDELNIRDLDILDEPDRLRRLGIADLTDGALPRSLRIALEHETLSGDVDVARNPTFANVGQILIRKPICHSDDDMGVSELLSALSTIVGPQVEDVFVLRSNDGWTFQDIVTLSACFPRIRTLHLTDMELKTANNAHYDSHYDDDSEGDSDSTDPDESGTEERNRGSEDAQIEEMADVDVEWEGGTGQETAGVFADSSSRGDRSNTEPEQHLDSIHVRGRIHSPSLEWIGFGDVSYRSLIEASQDHRPFRFVIQDLVQYVRPKLKRVDILHYVGDLEEFFHTYDTILEVVCISLCALQVYVKNPLPSCKSLRTLMIVVDLFPVRYRLVHHKLDTITFLIPVVAWLGRTRPSIRTVVRALTFQLLSSDLPALHTLHLCSEVPISAALICSTRKRLLKRSITLIYDERVC